MTAPRELRTTFMDWQKPFPAAVAERLIARWPAMNFEGVTVVVPGGKAGRRILALLADKAQSKGLAMFPPNFITVGELPEQLYRPPWPPADTYLRQVAWAAALQRAGDDSLLPLFPRLGAGGDSATRQGAATALDRCKDELATGLIGFDEILEKAATHNGLGSAERWQTAARLHAAYLDILRKMGLCDQQQARRDAVESSTLQAPGPIVLAGLAELSQQTRSMLNLISGHVETLIYAPPELADGFDRFGCVKTDFWNGRHIDLSMTKLRVAGTISQQADAVFCEIAQLGPTVRTDEISIGTPDESIVPHIETTAANLTNVPVRFGAGVLLSRTRPFQLLNVIADYLENGEFHQFSILIRHPDVEKYLRAESLHPTVPSADRVEPSEPGIGWRDWRTLLDRYAGEFLPLRLGPQCSAPEGWRADTSREESAEDERLYLAWLYSKIEALLGVLRKPEEANTATADQWAGPILALLHRVYGQKFDQSDDRQRLLVMACYELRAALDELHAAADVADRSHFPQVKAHEAIRGLASLCAARKLPPPLIGNEIEIVGWLELMPDDAPHLIITGFNEGLVPESSRTGPLLNETVREAMGLVRDPDRLARDAYLLTAMIQSRPPGAVTLISGRLSAQGDPLLPSRLMFACNTTTMAQRVLTTIDTPPRRAPLALRFANAQRSGFKIGAAIPPGLTPLTSMRVTSFRDYLASPQGFYLRHVLKLETLEESAPREFDSRQCGQVVHQVLKDFASTPAAMSNSRHECADTLFTLLQTRIDEKFGQSLPGALKFQVEMIRRRLEVLAEHQARWFADGWRILQTEWKPQTAAALAVDDLGMELRGRIDRIDYNENLNTWAVLDYKIASGGKTPEKTHRSGGAWTDLQLPLYRHLARELITDRPVQLGYVVISDRVDCTGHSMAGWDESALDDADNTARQIVRDVRQSKFGDIGDNPPTDGIFAHIFGEGMLISETGDDAEEESA